jgi:hypothetical protein
MTEEPSACISDGNGNLLFYVGSSNVDQISSSGAHSFTVRSFNDSIMSGGDSIVGNGSMTQGLLIIPFPDDTVKYYILHIDYPGNRLYYSIVDMSLNNGLGMVATSNVLLTDTISEKLSAVKAANGKDWWLITIGNNPLCSFYKYKIDSSGIQFKGKIAIPQTIYAWAGQLMFSVDGSKLLSSGNIGSTYIYDFNRCTGEINNPTFIDSYASGANMQVRYGCSFSPSGKYIYLSSSDSLWQFDTQSANVSATRQLIFSRPNSNYYLGQHLLGPDDKIYISNSYYDPVNGPNDSLSTNLSVINSPDSSGISCNFTPYAFGLKNRKSYLGIPNIPNYNLGVLENVNCDSILGTGIIANNRIDFKLYPNPSSNSCIIDLNNIPERKCRATLCTIEGQIVKDISILPSIRRTYLELSELHAGVYFVKVSCGEYISYSHKLVIIR